MAKTRDPHARDAVAHRVSTMLVAGMLVGCAVMGLPAQAADAVGAPSIDEVFAAGERFDAMVQGAAQRGDMPQRVDPAVAEMLDRIANLDVLAPGRFGVDDLETVLRLCSAPARITSRYLLFGVEQRIDASIAPEALGSHLQALATENAARFRDEMMALVPVQIRCSGVQAALLSEFARTLPQAERTSVRIAGVRQFQAGVQNLYLGTLSMLVDGTLDVATRGPILRELDLATAQVADALPLAGRLLLMAGVMSVGRDDPGLLHALDTTLRALTDAGCGELCALVDAPGA